MTTIIITASPKHSRSMPMSAAPAARTTRTTRIAALLPMVLLLAVLLNGCGRGQQSGKAFSVPSAEQQLVEGAADALDRLAAEPGVPPFTHHLASARGIIIFPALYKGSYIFGLQGGHGVLLGRTANGEWSPPSFVTLTDLSFGFQAGGQVTTAALLLMDEEYLDKALRDNLTLSADISAAAGPAGHSAQLDYATHTRGIIHVAHTQGVAFSMALESGGIIVNHERNRNYYGMGTTPAEILAGRVDTPGAQVLRTRLTRHTEHPAQKTDTQ